MLRSNNIKKFHFLYLFQYDFHLFLDGDCTIFNYTGLFHQNLNILQLTEHEISDIIIFLVQGLFIESAAGKLGFCTAYIPHLSQCSVFGNPLWDWSASHYKYSTIQLPWESNAISIGFSKKKIWFLYFKAAHR